MVQCIPSGWSIVASATANSQLAGLLAGFVFTGFVILFSRDGPKNVQTLSLFVVGFAILGFDSYLFSYVTGSESDDVCARVWTAALVASGLLATGAVVLICGIAWLVVDYLEDTVKIQTESYLRAEGRAHKIAFFGLLTTVFPLAVQAPATLLLTSAMVLYVDVVQPSSPIAWKLFSLAAPVFATVCVAVLRTVRRRRTAKLALAAGSPAGAAGEVGRVYLYTIGLLLLYASFAPIFTGTMGLLPTATYVSLDRESLTLSVFIVSLAIPTALSSALCATIPDLSPAAIAKIDRAR